MESLATLSAASVSESAPAQQLQQQPQPPVSYPTGPPLNLMPSPPKPSDFLPPTGLAPAGVSQAGPPPSTPQSRPAPPATTSGAARSSSTPTSNPRLRSSIACARCRRSKIKCTNAGAGTTCEACAHSGRECVYPAPGNTNSGSAKRSSDIQGEDGPERVKRSRAKKPDPLADRSVIDYALRDNAAEPLRAQVAHMTGLDSHASPIRDTIWQSPVLTSRIWAEVFNLFQLHYGTELPFLHAPTFLPKLTEGPTAFGSSPTGLAPGEGPLVKQLVGLGLLTLTARFHETLVEYHWNTIARGVNTVHREPSAASDYYASALRNTLLGEDVFSDQLPTLEKVQALLMLALYDWSLSRGVQAWMYLGIAIRMAQTMGLFYEDMDPSEMWAMGFANGSLNLHFDTKQNFPSSQDSQESNSSDVFVEEESRRRTAWSCFVLDKFFSNGSSRQSVLPANDLRVQLPCGEKAWAFGERVCTPFLSGQCSHNGERTAKKMRLVRRKRERQGEMQIIDGGDPEAKPFRRKFEDNEETKVPCELDESEGLLSRFVKVSEIWGKVARKAHAGVASTNQLASKASIIASFEIEAALRQFKESSPRSFRLSDSNIRAHVAQHTSPPFTLLNGIYSICGLVQYRESLVFLPATLESPDELDYTDQGHDSPMKGNRHGASVPKFFSAARDFLSLFDACRSQRLLPGTPMMGFGLYLVAFAGVYAFNFPHMDSEGAVCGNDEHPRSILDNQQIVLEALRTLAQMRFQLPVAQHWFRTLHRLHTYYRKAAYEYKVNPQSFSRPQKALRRPPGKAVGNAALSATNLQERSESISRLDALFREFGGPEDDLQRPVPHPTPNGLNSDAYPHPSPPTSRPADIWNPVNNSNLSVGEAFNPQTGSPRQYPPLYQSHPTPSPNHSQPSSSAYDSHHPSLNPHVPSTLSSHPYPSSASSAPGQFTYHWTTMQQPISGEDVAAFIDGRSEWQWAAMKADWELTRDSAAENSIQGSGPTGSSSQSQEPRLFSRDNSPKPGWFGVLWGWV